MQVHFCILTVLNFIGLAVKMKACDWIFYVLNWTVCLINDSLYLRWSKCILTNYTTLILTKPVVGLCSSLPSAPSPATNGGDSGCKSKLSLIIPRKSGGGGGEGEEESCGRHLQTAVRCGGRRGLLNAWPRVVCVGYAPCSLVVRSWVWWCLATPSHTSPGTPLPSPFHSSAPRRRHPGKGIASNRDIPLRNSDAVYQLWHRASGEIFMVFLLELTLGEFLIGGD